MHGKSKIRLLFFFLGNEWTVFYDEWLKLQDEWLFFCREWQRGRKISRLRQKTDRLSDSVAERIGGGYNRFRQRKRKGSRLSCQKKQERGDSL